MYIRLRTQNFLLERPQIDNHGFDMHIGIINWSSFIETSFLMFNKLVKTVLLYVTNWVNEIYSNKTIFFGAICSDKNNIGSTFTQVFYKAVSSSLRVWQYRVHYFGIYLPVNIYANIISTANGLILCYLLWNKLSYVPFYRSHKYLR